ncbi:uncharacterized protein LOC62_02G003418 [Vanrija pseudolonga]|uniref:Integral membrane protein n=1 Tax=Vanrija pseudolonga TaxID=143232 RepID=A0AAF1BKR0_9TREE|nr:hypothetical protein LOC62_02G003418 [Vanrija pseudolonga]
MDSFWATSPAPPPIPPRPDTTTAPFFTPPTSPPYYSPFTSAHASPVYSPPASTSMAPPPPAAPIPRPLLSDAPTGVPAVRDAGAPNPTLAFCTSTVSTTSWYQLSGTPLLLCTHCHATRVSGSSLAASFVQLQTKGSCAFTTPRLKALLAAAARSSPSVLTEFVARRHAIGKCTAASTESGYHVPSAPGLAACEACYQDVVLASPFASNFAPTPKAGSCAFALPAIQRAFITLSETVDGWTEFLDSASRRLLLPRACTGASVPSHGTKWYTTKQAIHGLVLCEGCHADHVAYTRYGAEFVPYPSAAGQNWSCDFHGATRAAWTFAVQHGEFADWWRAAERISLARPCDATLHVDEWYGLAGADMDLCAAHHAVVEVMGLGRYFSPRSPGQSRACDLSDGAQRVDHWTTLLLEALATGVWAPLAEHARVLSTLPLCPRRKALENATWYGWPELLICPDCWVSFASGTALASLVPLCGFHRTERAICSLYSDTMREAWTNACISGDVASLLGYSASRAQVYWATIPRIEMIIANAQRQQRARMVAGRMSNQYGLMQGLTLANGTLPTHASGQYGGGSLGWHQTPYGATAAGYEQQMGPPFVSGGKEEVAFLETEWQKVE